MWSVWEFKSVRGAVRVIRPAEAEEQRFENERQRVVYRSESFKEARRNA